MPFMIYDQIENSRDSLGRSPNRKSSTAFDESRRLSAVLPKAFDVANDETGNVYSKFTGRAPVFPWGVNPVISNVTGSDRQTQTPSTSPKYQYFRRDVPLINDTEAYARCEASSPVRDYVFSADESIEYVDTSEISTGIGPLLDILRSVLSFFARGGDSPREPASDQTDIETGLQLCEASVEESKPVISEFDRLHGAPVRFPSSIDELFTYESAPCKSYPLPQDDPPPIPPLPVPRLRNTSYSVAYSIFFRVSLWYM
jgi:hypothetical protein